MLWFLRLRGLRVDNNKLNMLVQKSNPLLSLLTSDMTLEEFKILDVYLAHINSRDPSTRDVIFSQSELEELLNVKRIRPESLRVRLNHLLGTVLTLGDISSPKEVKQITLFSMAISEKGRDNRWMLHLRCTDDALKYVFDIESIGYIKYRLKKIVSIKSRYSYSLYMYLLHNAFRKKWVEDPDNLKCMLSANLVSRYEEFKYFNREVLQKAADELNQKEIVHFSYTPVRSWKTVVGVEFTVFDLLDKAEPDKKKEELQDIGFPSSPFSNLVELLQNACNNEFNIEETTFLVTLINRHPDIQDKDDLAKYHYLESMYAKLNTVKDVGNRYAYLSGMIKNEIK